MSWTLMRTWIKLILRDSKTLSPLPDGSDSAVRDRTYCYDWGELEPAQQISLFYIWKVCRFCPQQRNCPTISNIPRVDENRKTFNFKEIPRIVWAQQVCGIHTCLEQWSRFKKRINQTVNAKMSYWPYWKKVQVLEPLEMEEIMIFHQICPWK